MLVMVADDNGSARTGRRGEAGLPGRVVRVCTAMATEPEELDRVVSRRVEHPTDATTDDERAYRAAAPSAEAAADTDTGGSGGAAERASRDMDGPDEDDEPTRPE